MPRNAMRLVRVRLGCLAPGGVLLALWLSARGTDPHGGVLLFFGGVFYLGIVASLLTIHAAIRGVRRRRRAGAPEA